MSRATTSDNACRLRPVVPRAGLIQHSMRTGIFRVIDCAGMER